MDSKNDDLRVEVVEVTPEMAKEWLELNRGNRNIRKTKWNLYLRDMLAGNWRPRAVDPIRFHKDGSLCDGQHRLIAHVESGMTFKYIVVYGLDDDDRDALDQGATRSAADVLKFRGVDHYTQQAASLIRILKTWDDGHLSYAGASAIVRPTQGEYADLLEEYDEALSAIPWAASIHRDLGLTVTPLAAARVLMERVAPVGEVDRFWDGVTGAEGTSEKDPRRTLTRWARNRAKLSNGRIENSHQLFAIFTAWNRWRRGESLTQFRPVLRNPTYNEAGAQVSPIEYAPMPTPR